MAKLRVHEQFTAAGSKYLLVSTNSPAFSAELMRQYGTVSWVNFFKTWPSGRQYSFGYAIASIMLRVGEPQIYNSLGLVSFDLLGKFGADVMFERIVLPEGWKHEGGRAFAPLEDMPVFTSENELSQPKPTQTSDESFYEQRLRESLAKSQQEDTNRKPGGMRWL